MNQPEDRNKLDSDLSALRHELCKYQTLVDANGIGYVILDENGCVLEANSQYVSFSGHQQIGEILGRNIVEWTLDSERETMRRAIAQCLTAGPIQNYQTKYVNEDGLISAIAINMIKDETEGCVRLLALCRDITSYVFLAESAQREKSFIDAVLESAPFLLYEYDDQLRLIRWNKRSETISGFTADELAGMHLYDWFSEEDIPRITNALENIRNLGYAAVEANIRTKDGRWIPYYCTAVSLIVDEKHFFTGIAIDLSELKQFEQALRMSEERLRTFINNSQDGIVIVDGQGRIKEWNAAEERITGITRDEALGQLLWDIQYRICPPELRTPSALEAAKQRILSGLAEGNSLQRLIEEPIVRPDGGRRTLQTTIFASRAGDQVWAGGITRDVTGPKRAEEILRQSEERLRTLIERAPVPIGLGRGGKLLYANAQFIQMLRAESIDQITRVPMIEYFAPQCRTQIREYLQNRERGLPAPSEYEAVGLRFDGTQFLAYLAVTRVELADGPVSLAFVTDVTESRKASEAIKAERDRARQYLQVVEVMIISLDFQGTITLVNRKGCQILGYSDENELIGKNWFKQCIPASDRTKIADLFRSVMSGTLSPYEFYENPIVTKDGRHRLIAWHNTYLRDSAGNIVSLLSSGEEITERRQAEANLKHIADQLQTNQQRLSVAIESLQAGVWDVIMEPDGLGEVSEVIYVTQKMLDLLGFSEDIKAFSMSAWEARVLPEDRRLRKEAIRRSLSGDCEYYECTFRARHLDGSIRWLSARGKVNRMIESGFIRATGLTWDVTDQKRAEEKVAQVDEELRVEREALKQKNIALQELLEQINRNRQEMATQIQANVDRTVLPIMDRLAPRLDAQGKRYLNMAKESLAEILSPFVSSVESVSRKLTQSEIELCHLIRRGSGSKEIAELRGCSVQTVIKQRKNVRKKLGIAGEDINLATYLSSILPAPTETTPRSRAKKPK